MNAMPTGPIRPIGRVVAVDAEDECVRISFRGSAGPDGFGAERCTAAGALMGEDVLIMSARSAERRDANFDQMARDAKLSAEERDDAVDAQRAAEAQRDNLLRQRDMLLEATHMGSTSPLALIIAERSRQIETEGYTHRRDDGYVGGQLAQAAAAYAFAAIGTAAIAAFSANAWPWRPELFKPRDPRANLIRAGALILAELERLDRLDARFDAATSSAGEEEAAAIAAGEPAMPVHDDDPSPAEQIAAQAAPSVDPPTDGPASVALPGAAADVGGSALNAEHKLRCGDVVRLGDEELLVAFADYEAGAGGMFAWAGWPAGMAKISDATLVKAATDDEHAASVARWHELRHSPDDWRLERFLRFYPRPEAAASAEGGAQ